MDDVNVIWITGVPSALNTYETNGITMNTVEITILTHTLPIPDSPSRYLVNVYKELYSRDKSMKSNNSRTYSKKPV